MASCFIADQDYKTRARAISMSKKGRISHDRIEALEKRVAELEAQLQQLTQPPAGPVTVTVKNPRGEYQAQFERWPGNER